MTIDPNDESSRGWIVENSKKFPNDPYQIEKNDGCDHMTCIQGSARKQLEIEMRDKVGKIRSRIDCCLSSPIIIFVLNVNLHSTSNYIREDIFLHLDKYKNVRAIGVSV